MPATVYLVTGGARSGKSSYAQRLAESICPNPVYLATSKVWDDDFAGRVKKHQNERGDAWTTIEEPMTPSAHKEEFAGRAILVDCLTLWLTNYMMEEGVFTEPDKDKDATNNDGDATTCTTEASDRALEKIKAEFDALISQWNATFVFVTNEIGSGLHGESNASRKFVDSQGWFNQHVANKANMVVHMVAGQPNIIKDFAAEKRSPLKAPGSDELKERQVLDKFLSSRDLTMDSKGYFLVKLDHEKGIIRASYHSCIVNDKGEVCDIHGNKLSCHGNNRPEPMKTFEARTAKELTVQIFERWEHAAELVSVGHAAYIGRESQKAEQCLFAGEFYQQD
mmetsp:Transcript_15814/g.45546  ORF Transcript_15814/g.45546 Transcript_15814/m.45546 type:complete len:337 (-) Transcript_15814:84-1094(-)